jgi:hypothetical protein
LSEIVANLLAFAASPTTLAFKEDEIVIAMPFDSVDHLGHRITGRALTSP